MASTEQAPSWDPERYYQPSDLGPVCPGCHCQIPKALALVRHPTCFERDQPLMNYNRAILRG